MRNGWKNRSKLIALLLAFTLVFVAGCQAVSGVDFNKVLKNAIKVSSSEGSQTIEFKLELDEEIIKTMPEEEQAIAELFSSIKLQLDAMKMQDADHLSLSGKLTLGNAKSMAFALQMSDELAVMTLEGAKQPFVLDLTSEGLLSLAGLEAESADNASAPAVDEASLTAMGHQMLDTIGNYIIDNLPNPQRLTVKPTVESINGESVSLMHVHADLDGSELWTLVKKYVDALVADRDGLKQMVKGVLEIFQNNPDLWNAVGEVNPFENPELDAPTLEETIETTAEEIAGLLEELQQSIRSMTEEDQKAVDEIMNKDLQMKLDIYVDSKLDIRKQQMEVSFIPSEKPEQSTPQEIEDDYDYEDEYYDEFGFVGLGIKGVSLKVSSESWNVNGAVKADAPVASANAAPVDEMMMMQGYQQLKLFNEDSFVYDLLKNTMHINRQTVSWSPYSYGNPAIITPSYITIIPLRDTAEMLGAELIYDKKTKSIKLYDEATDTTVSIKLNSDTATVNGKAVKWSFPATVIDGVTYVPARDLAKALKAKISWSVIYETEKVFTFEREV